jgi:hypothetical protein
MKLTIEIADDALRAAVTAQVGKALAEMTAEEIRKKADLIVAAKFERFSVQSLVESKVEEILRRELKSIIDVVLGSNHYSRDDKVQKIARDLVKEALRK